MKYTLNILTIFLLLSVSTACGEKHRARSDRYKAPVEANKRVQHDIDPAQVSTLIRADIEAERIRKYMQDYYKASYLQGELKKFYETNNYQIVWYKNGMLSEQAEDLVSALQIADEDGLNPEDYHLQAITNLQRELFHADSKNFSVDKLVELELYSTSAYLAYASHLLSGRIDPRQSKEKDSSWVINPRQKDLAVHLSTAMNADRIQASLSELAPQYEQYALLKKQLARYRGLMSSGGWPNIVYVDSTKKKTKPLQFGDSLECVAALRKRLSTTGDLTNAGAPQPARFDSAMVAAVKRFQNRHGLKEDGKVDAKTLAMLNATPEERIAQIAINMERLRWLPETLGERYLLVNIPEYKLKVYEEGTKVIEMKVIVGKDYTTTPIFNDIMEYIVFSPTWAVPHSIATQEILPILRRNPGYLYRNNFLVYRSWDAKAPVINPYAVNWRRVQPTNFPYRIVQQPGRKNPLGLVKFVFPNDNDVYLHDTPDDHLFNRAERSLSHGCIRIERPEELADYLLKDKKGWSTAKTIEHMHKRQPYTVPLAKKMPVQIVYHTAWIDENGVENFRTDIYKHDSIHFAAMQDILKKVREHKIAAAGDKAANTAEK